MDYTLRVDSPENVETFQVSVAGWWYPPNLSLGHLKKFFLIHPRCSDVLVSLHFVPAIMLMLVKHGSHAVQMSRSDVFGELRIYILKELFFVVNSAGGDYDWDPFVNT